MRDVSGYNKIKVKSKYYRTGVTASRLSNKDSAMFCFMKGRTRNSTILWGTLPHCIPSSIHQVRPADAFCGSSWKFCSKKCSKLHCCMINFHFFNLHLVLSLSTVSPIWMFQQNFIVVELESALHNGGSMNVAVEINGIEVSVGNFKLTAFH